MSECRVTNFSDPCLSLFLKTADDVVSQHWLERIVTDHEPLIKQIIGQKLRCYLTFKGESAQNQDAEDVFSEVRLKLIERLLNCKNNPQAKNIENLRGYVASLTYYICNNYLRQKYPQRHSLKNNIRYLMKTYSEFDIWEKDGYWFCGLASWYNNIPSEEHLDAIEKLQNNIYKYLYENTQGTSIEKLHPADLLTLIFKFIKAPILIDDLVNILASAWGVKDHQAISYDINFNNGINVTNDQSVYINSELELRSYLKYLWEEITQLPQRQRVALLLNLKSNSGQDIITLFPATQTASIQQIAQILEIKIERFVEIWGNLPMEDSEIADLLGVTRQQVINLRKCARQRLQRKMQVWGINFR
jgi:RNA polymerase sigma factor (sigma-70 family)